MSVLVVGSLNVDLIAYTPHLPKPGETILGSKYEMGCGGKGANQAVQCAMLGTTTTMIGAVGDDANGAWYLSRLAESGVNGDRVKIVPNSTTGVAPITVSTETAENCIVVVPGANLALTSGDIDAVDMSKASHLVCQNEIAPETTAHALQLAKAKKLTTVYSPAPCPPRDYVRGIAHNIDYLLANQTEATELSGTLDLEKAAREINAWGASNVIITKGADGYAILTNGVFTTHPAVKVTNPVDTTGAGDSFVGGFVHSLASSKATITDACVYAARVAALSVMKKGTQKSYPSGIDLA